MLEKKYDDFTIEGDTWSVTLTQEETNLFKADYDSWAELVDTGKTWTELSQFTKD